MHTLKICYGSVFILVLPKLLFRSSGVLVGGRRVRREGGALRDTEDRAPVSSVHRAAGKASCHHTEADY